MAAKYQPLLSQPNLPNTEYVTSNTVFFTELSKLRVNDELERAEFFERYGQKRFKISGLSDNIQVVGADKDSPIFEDFSLDMWKQYYIQENVIQIGILCDRSPIEGLFVGSDTGKVYACVLADDFSQQKITCVASSLDAFVWKAPQQHIECKNKACLTNSCYGCFDPVLRDRLLRF